MCNGESAYKNLFEDEFRALTKWEMIFEFVITKKIE